MASAPPTWRNRILSPIILAICGLLAIAAGVVGIDDNPPGILLAFLAAAAFVIAFVHPWRATSQFICLLLASILGLALFIVLNISLDMAAQNPAAAEMLRDLLQSTIVEAFSIVIAMICSAAFFVGAAGSVAMFIRNRRQKPNP